MNPATLFAEVFVDELTRLPLSGVVVCPGSRSTPLAVAFSRQKRVPVYVHLDERSAAYFALGLALETRRPAAIVTTSGTATANLHPAVLEADRAGVPLLLLTADRPPELRDSGANQTADQIKLYGTAVRWYLELPLPEPSPAGRTLRQLRATADRAVAAAQGLLGRPGPVHLNFPFRKPLEPSPDDPTAREQWRTQHPLGAQGREGTRPLTTITLPPRVPTTSQLASLADRIRACPKGLITAGPRAAPNALTAQRLIQLAQQTAYPLLADALSGLRFGGLPSDGLLATYPHFLAAGLPATSQPCLVLHLGAAPTSNALLHYLETLPASTEMIAISPEPAWPAPGFRLSQWLVGDPEATLALLLETLPRRAPAARPWLACWQAAERLTRDLLQQSPRTEGALLAEIVEALPPETRLVVGNSLPVRHLDEYALPTTKPLRLYANRGVSGIDGVVSTAAGVAAASPRPTVLVLGDLSLLHDLGGLLAIQRFGLDNFHIVVLNNDGGGIFARLPIAQHEPPFTAMFRTPHGLNFAPAAEMYGLRYASGSAQALTPALQTALAQATPHLIEIHTDAQKHETARQNLLARLTKLAQTQSC